MQAHGRWGKKTHPFGLPKDLKELLLVGDFDILIPSDDICNLAEEKQKREEMTDACPLTTDTTLSKKSL